jgi:hypothetical protein
MKIKIIDEDLCGLKNQTKYIPENEDQLGIAFFLYEDENSDKGMKKIKEEDISYKNTLLKGENVDYFKFLPYGIEITIGGEKCIVKKGMFD